MSHVELIPIFDDNYVFMIVEGREAILVDPGEAVKALDLIQQKNLTLKAVLVTHHHPDHIDGLPKIKTKFPEIPIYAPLKNKTQIPLATHFVQEGDSVLDYIVMELPGHTLGHIAFYDQKNNRLFSGDVLFGLGCGRLFEGTPEVAFSSLSRIKSLPANSLIYCTHEYTETNLKFCKSLNMNIGDYEEALFEKRKGNSPSVPLNLGSELKSNPFLLCNNVSDFAVLRRQRNQF
ncbi:MAG: hydroxyacylglutathione hydrolase [Pseudobdellovibrio sp.]